MLETVKTIYRNGAFVPLKPFGFPEGAEIEIVVETVTPHQNGDSKSNVEEPTVTDPEERNAVLARLFKRWDENPIPADAPRKFTREDFYERR